MDKAAQYLGLARKGGMLAVGEEGSGTAIAAGKGRLLMLAADASPNAQKRAAGFLYGHRAPLQTLPWTKAELSAMLGKRGCSMLCFTDLPLAAQIDGELPLRRADDADQFGFRFLFTAADALPERYGFRQKRSS